jgi:iron complex transport system substrate-binding protein
MRIVSLLPSATEICHALGLMDQVVGVSHDCDWPEEVKDKPVLSSTSIDPEQSKSKEIDEAVKHETHDGNSIYHVDAERLRELDPDLILTQELCEVCAPSFDEVQEASRTMKGDTTVVSLEPSTLSEILDNITQVGELTGTESKAKDLVASLQDRINYVEQAPDPEPSPRVLSLEWIEPPYLAGHWVPEMIEIIGATPMNEPGVHSRQAEWGALNVFQPNMVILMPCGFDPDRTQREISSLDPDHQLFFLDPVQEGNVYSVNGSFYFNRPGPRAITGLEVLAKIICPDTFDDLTVPDDAIGALTLPVQ